MFLGRLGGIYLKREGAELSENRNEISVHFFFCKKLPQRSAESFLKIGLEPSKFLKSFLITLQGKRA